MVTGRSTVTNNRAIPGTGGLVTQTLRDVEETATVQLSGDAPD